MPADFFLFQMKEKRMKLGQEKVTKIEKKLKYGLSSHAKSTAHKDAAAFLESTIDKNH